MIRPSLLWLVGLLLAAGLTPAIDPARADEEPKRPNILLIVSDDMHQLFDVNYEKRLNDAVYSRISATNRIAGNPVQAN